MAKNWWDYDPIYDFQQKFDFATYPVQGVDIPMPCDTPIINLFDGIIVNLYYDNGGGQIVIQIDDPSLSRGIPFYGFAHLDAIDLSFGVGTRVKAGQLLGWSGGQNIGQAVGTLPFGYTHHYAAPNYSSGAHLEAFLSKNKWIPYTSAQITDDLNPYWLLDYGKSVFGANRITVNPVVLLAGSHVLTPQKQKKPEQKQITEKSGINDILGNIDVSMYISNPFDVTTTGFDPVGWFSQFISNIFGDIGALILRFILIALGIFVLYLVFEQFINVEKVTNTAKTTKNSLLSKAKLLL